MTANYDVQTVEGGVPIKMWTRGVPVDDKARVQLASAAKMACRKDEGVIDESPRAYKPIEAVMAAQADLVEIVHTLKQVVCVKG